MPYPFTVQNGCLDVDPNDCYDDDDNYSYHSVYHLSNGVIDATQHSFHLHCRFLEEKPIKHSFFPSPQAHPPLYNSYPVGRADSSRRTTFTHTRQRSLTDASSGFDDEMTTFGAEAPGSPPGLTGSKSSKSSSYHSSSFSGADGILSDITHFEDIGLGEEYQPFQRNLLGMEKTSRPLPRTSATTTSGPRSNAAAMTTLRELTNVGQRPMYPKLQSSMAVQGPRQSLSLPNGRPMRKVSRNSSTPSLAIRAMSNANRSRSPSPNSASPDFASPMSRPIPSPKSPRRPGIASVHTNPVPLRRGSWQPNRKSVKELEAECNDSDEDDLPDDTSLWNVPLSPRPPTERKRTSVSDSATVSPCTSPERPSPLRSSIGMNSLQGPKTAPAGSSSKTFSSNLISPPTSPWRPKTMRGSSTGGMPDHFGGYLPTRTKSWNVALSELSEEAQALTETLENHAVTAERKHEEAVQNGEVTVGPRMEKLSRAKTSTVDLPPLKLTNIMIDPLPISKEKERVLSRTRPSWLPPKSQKEEKKHLKEYKRMMEFSLESERRKAATLATAQCAQDDTKSTLLRIWEEHVLPNWDRVICEPRTRELWWRGVSPKSRGLVWPRAVGNDLALTPTTYTVALRRAIAIDPNLHPREAAWFAAIRRDVALAFPALHIFQPNGPLHNDLIDVLMAYAMYRSDVGYAHGTHLIAAHLLLTLPSPSAAFTTLANLLNRPLPLAFLTGDPAGTSKTYSLILSLLQLKSPRLHAHLFTSDSPTSLHLHPPEVLEPMLRTLFLGPGGGVGVEAAGRLWDVLVFEGDTAVVRAAVAVLVSLEGRLYGDRISVLQVLGWGASSADDSASARAWDLGTEETFMARVRSMGKERKGESKAK